MKKKRKLNPDPKCPDCGGEGYWSNPFDQQFRCDCVTKQYKRKKKREWEGWALWDDNSYYEFKLFYSRAEANRELKQWECLKEAKWKIIRVKVVEL